MKVQPVPQPSAPTAQQSSPSQDARARAISRLTEQPVPNANNVSAEEMGAIRQPTSGHLDTDETLEDTEVKTPSPKEDPALSAQFAKLARQEKQLRMKQQQQDQSLRAREAAIAAKEQELTAKGQEYSPDRFVPRDRIKQNALEVLAEAGISYDELTQQILNQPQTDPRTNAEIKALRAELQAIRDDAKKGVEQNTQAQQAQYQQAVKQIETEARQLIKVDPAYEMVKATNSVRDVVELIEQTFQKDGILLSVEEAAQQVEDYLFEEAEKLTKIDKIKKRIAQNASKSEQSTTAQTAQSQGTKQPQPMKTLTNASASTRTLSGRERALLAFKGELK